MGDLKTCFKKVVEESSSSSNEETKLVVKIYALALMFDSTHLSLSLPLVHIAS